ncbi:MAG: RHS repeat-associated core domain-containing protein [Chloroflexota bacterium]
MSRAANISQSDAFLYENQDAPIQLRQTVTQDQYGNPIEEFNYGQVCIDESDNEDLSCGDDERLRYTDYAINEEQWLLRFPSRIWQTDENGAFVSERINFYDGEDYVGLAQGQITKGHLKRQSDNLGPLDDNRFVDSLRQAFDEYGNVIGMMDANARPDASGGTVEVHGNQGHLTTISYDSLIHTFPVAEYIHLDGGMQLSVAAAYHLGYGKITAVTDFNGNVSRYTYDAFGRMENIALPGDTLELPTQQFVYDLGRPRSSIMTISRERSGEEAVRRSIVYYDGLGRAVQTRHEAENGQFAVEEATTFNARQSENQKFLPYYDSTFDFAPPDSSLAHTTTHYDPLARAIRIDNPDDSFTSIVFKPLQQLQYDEEDNRADSPHVDTPKTLTYDGLERLVGVQEVNRTNDVTERYNTSYGYDLLDNLTRFTDAQGNVKTMSYDGLSRKLHMDDPDRGEMHYAYDDFGNVTSTTDAKGQTIEYAYDGANRLVREQWLQPDGSYTAYAEFHYDNDRSPRHPEAVNTLGQITYIIDEAGEAAFSYDARGNVTGQSRYFAAEDLDFITLMSYDATDRLATITYPDGRTISYTYNAHGLLESVPGFVENIDYVASGQQDSMTYTNGVVRDYGYDSRLRMETLRSTAGSTILQDLSYTFDDNSNIIAIGDHRTTKTDQNDQTQQYQYDALYRLTNATGTYGQIDYAYDSLGNMTRKTSTAADARLNIGDMRYGENGAGPRALTAAGIISQQYDANGNLSNKDDARFTWDYRDQLRSVGDGEMVSTYIYDSNGQRTHQTVTKGDVVTKTLYASEYTELRGDSLAQYVFAEGRRIAQFKAPLTAGGLIASFDEPNGASPFPESRIWYVSDHLGGTNHLISERQEEISATGYYPFGLTRYKQGTSSNRYGFTGKELDDTGLHYFGARFYDSMNGRFISIDPLYVEELRSINLPQSLNLYAYSFNNPVVYYDPDGLEGRKISEAKLIEIADPTVQGSKKYTNTNSKGNMFIGASRRATLGKARIGAEANDSYGVTGVRIDATARGISAKSAFGYQDGSVKGGLGAEFGTMEICGQMCAVICASVCGSIGPQVGVEASIGRETKFSAKAAVVGAKFSVSAESSRIEGAINAVKHVADRLEQGMSNFLKELERSILHPQGYWY